MPFHSDHIKIPEQAKFLYTNTVTANDIKAYICTCGCNLSVACIIDSHL